MKNQQNLKPIARFGTTHWSVVLRAAVDGSSGGQQALTQLITAYWYPLYAFARRLGSQHHDAMDQTQGFFTHVLATEALSDVSPEKGRFRSFLLSSFKNFLANQRRAAKTVRRGGTVTTLSLSGEDFQSRYDQEPADADTPELLFQRRWVEALLRRVRARLAEDYRQAGKEALFQLLEPHLSDGVGGVARVHITRQLNLSSAAVAMSIHRMRRRFGYLLRQEVAATVDDPTEIDDELRSLLAIVASDRWIQVITSR